MNCGERYRAGERVSTGFVESAIDRTRTRVLNGDLDRLIRRRYPAFRRPHHTLPPLCDALPQGAVLISHPAPAQRRKMGAPPMGLARPSGESTAHFRRGAGIACLRNRAVHAPCGARRRSKTT